MEKYLIKLAKPEFKTTVVEVEAESEENAAIEGFLQAAVLPDEAWQSCKDQDYIIDIQMILPTSDESYFDDREYVEEAHDICYLPLKADCDTGEGSVPLQPWLMEQDSLLLADVLRDWQIALDAIYEEHIKEHGKQLEVMKKNLSLKKSDYQGAKVIPFPTREK